jgi:hypothetical protein
MLARTSVDQVAGSIAMAMAASIGVTLALHWIFNIVPAANAPAGAPAQRRKTSTTANRLATNQTSLPHSPLPFTRNGRCGHDLSAGNRATATRRSVSNPIGDSPYTRTRRYS